jgi:hypothetical protein
MPKFFKRKTLLVKKEVTYGLDPVPTGAANAILAQNVKIMPMQGQNATRDIDVPYFQAPQNFPTGIYQEISFDLELIGAAAPGNAPAWSAIATACGLQEVISAGVSVTYNPVSANFSSATIYLYIDDVLFKVTGVRGDIKPKLGVHGLPMMECRMLGLFNLPIDTANATPTLTAFQQPQVANADNTPTCTFNGVAVKARSYDLSFGGKLVYRELMGSSSKEVLVTDREPAISMQIEATTMAVINPYSLSKNQTAFAINISHGVGAGKITTIAAPNCRLNRPDQNAEQDNIWEWPLSITPLPTAGNDEFSIVLT